MPAPLGQVTYKAIILITPSCATARDENAERRKKQYPWTPAAQGGNHNFPRERERRRDEPAEFTFRVIRGIVGNNLKAERRLINVRTKNQFHFPRRTRSPRELSDPPPPSSRQPDGDADTLESPQIHHFSVSLLPFSLSLSPFSVSSILLRRRRRRRRQQSLPFSHFG